MKEYMCRCFKYHFKNESVVIVVSAITANIETSGRPGTLVPGNIVFDCSVPYTFLKIFTALEGRAGKYLTRGHT